MNHLLDGAMLLCGLAALVYGSDRAVTSATAIARSLGVSVFFIGVTLVAIGSSLPEIATSIYAAAYGAGDLLVGHIVGSATSQITLGIGIVALVSPLSLAREKVRTYGGGMMAAMGAMLVVLWSGDVTRIEGVVLALGYLGFVLVRYEHADYRDDVTRIADPNDVSHPLVWLAVGIGFVVAGGHLLVTGATALATDLGTPDYLLGLVTGLGTTAPEIAIAALAVYRGQSGIAVGTLFGSNITDPLFSLGVGAAVGGVQVAHRSAAVTSVAYMLVASAAVVAVFYHRERVGRMDAMGCLLLYVPTFVFV
ncbi:sodium:calcium antiporter [Haloplanus sp. GCM10025708]|uniref:sodium:calcium antiporter n=1 Tax=Haloferacaceae TaxID=1644056 RepID=UPI0036133C28